MKIFSLFFLLFVCAMSAQAQLNLTVTRSDDRNAVCVSGDCSLREAVNAANASAADDTINFVAGLTRITLTNEIAVINGTLTINGSGANVLTIDGGAGYNRIFYTEGANVTIKGVTLTGGDGSGGFRSGYGGAIYANFSSLVLDGVHVTANSAWRDGGGVHFAEGNHQILNSTFSDNAAENCGAFFNQGYSTLVVANSTITGNRGRGYGGGFCNTGEATLRSVTITDNYAFYGGGIYQGDIDFSGEVYGTFTLNLGNTIVAGNIAGIGSDIYFGSGALTSAGYNLIGDNRSVEAAFPGGTPNAKHDIVGANPLLGPLADNGGTTPTRSLLYGSPAIDKGNAFGSTTDQRGLTRPVDFDNETYPNATSSGDGSDIGAYEAQTAPTAPTVISIDDGDADDLITTGETLTYTVTFSKDIDASTVSSSDFDNAGTASITIGTITETSAGVFTVQVTPTTAGTVILRIPSGADIRDTSHNRLVTPVQDDTTVTANDITTPIVVSIVRASANPTKPNTSVQFTVTFSESVTGVDSTDFTLTAANLSGASITNVMGSGKTYTVTINTGTLTANQTSGTLRLDVVDNDSIKDASNNPLGGAGASNGNYSSGESYTVNDFTSFVVTKTDDTNDGVCDADCSLREAMTAANADPGAETITFDIAGAGPHTIQLASSLPALSENADILNTSGESITVKGVGIENGFRVFRLINFGVTVNMSNLTISNGFADDFYGGGIRNNGTLTLTGCIISSNTSTQYGGGIFNLGTLTLTGSTVDGNYAKSYGSGIYNGGVGGLTVINSTISNNDVGDSGGGIYNGGSTMTVTNSTISGNSANFGGGIFNDEPGNLTVTNSTISNNSAGYGAGIYNKDGATATLGSSIIAKNSAIFRDSDLQGAFTSSGYNLMGDNTGATISANTGDQIGTQSAPINPLLGPLADNGGPTQTHALLPGSPAIDKGNATGTDQRGFARPVDNLAITNAANGADIGAFEVQLAPTAAPVSVSGRVTTSTGRGIRNVVITMTDSQGNVRTATTTSFGYYRFEEVAAGETYIFAAWGKRFSFEQNAQVHSITEDTNDINFIANEHSKLSTN